MILLKLGFLLASFPLFATETRQKIALVDTGISEEQFNSIYSCTTIINLSKSENIYDTNGHGTILFDIIKTYIDYNKQCIESIKIFGEEKKEDSKFIANQINTLTFSNYLLFNMSFSGVGGYSLEEKEVSRRINKESIAVFAAGNNRKTLTKQNCDAFYVCYGYGVGVASSDNDNSNIGYLIRYYIKGYQTYKGSSMAAAHVSGLIAKKSLTDKEFIDKLKTSLGNDNPIDLSGNVSK